MDFLKGIDETECDSEDGWWETSTGANFGAEIKAKIEHEIAARDERIAELVAERDRLLAIVSKIADAQGLGYEAFGDAIYNLILEAKAALATNEG